MSTESSLQAGRDQDSRPSAARTPKWHILDGRWVPGLIVAWRAAIHAEDKARALRTIRAFGARMQAQFAAV